MGENKKEKVKREFSSGGVVIKDRNLFLIAKSNPTPDYPGEYWRLPKGWIDDSGIDIPGPKASGRTKITEEDLKDTAIREVREEGGVKAEIIKKIKTINYLYRHKTRGLTLKFVTYYLMDYVEDLKEGFGFETERTEWLNFSDAHKRLNNTKEKEILQLAQELLYDYLDK